MKIVGVTNYEGEFREFDLSFMMMTEEPGAFVVYEMETPQGQSQVTEIMRFNKDELLNPDAFPEAIGKFVPEIVALIDPIEVDHLPSYKEATQLFTDYFKKYGEVF